MKSLATGVLISFYLSSCVWKHGSFPRKVFWGDWAQSEGLLESLGRGALRGFGRSAIQTLLGIHHRSMEFVHSKVGLLYPCMCVYLDSHQPWWEGGLYSCFYRILII